MNDKGVILDKSFGQTEPFPAVNINDKAKTVPLIKEFFDKGHSCQVIGSLDLSKVTGQINMQLQGQSQALQEFLKDNRQKYDNKYKV